MATVMIHRTNEYVNRMRNYSVYIDGKKTGTIANGETKAFNTSTGNHPIVTKIDWCSSKSLAFDIMDNQVKNFKVGGFKHGNWLIPVAIFLIVISYVLNLKYNFGYLIYLTIPVFLLLVYYITLGRKRYLTLTEINL